MDSDLIKSFQNFDDIEAVIIHTLKDVLSQVHVVVLFVLFVSVLIYFILSKKFKLQGVVIYILSFIIFNFSLIFKNLFLKFVSSSILLLFIMIMIYYIFCTIYFKRHSIKISSVIDNILHPFEELNLNFHADKIPFQFPGIYFLLAFSVYENNEKQVDLKRPVISTTKDSFSINIHFTRHGEFILKNSEFILRDIFGFTAFKVKIDYYQVINVFPDFVNNIKIPFFLEKGGEEIVQSLNKENSTDFFENRKYYPGDDTRRINWKIFAHSGELHIREVEKIPPKTGRISIFFAPYSKELKEYEMITSNLLSTVNYLLKYDFKIKIFSPSYPDGIIIDKNEEKKFNNLLNFSYKKMSLTNEIMNEKMIYFTSFEEYENLIDDLPGKTFCALSYYNETFNLKEFFNVFFRINQSDNLLLDMYNKITSYKHNTEKSERFKLLKDKSLSKKIELKIL